MASGHGSPDPGRDARRTNDVRPDRGHAGIEPERRTDVYRAEAAQLGAPKAQAGYVMDVYDGADWTEMDIEYQRDSTRDPEGH
jgi:hypothetical protein